MKCSNHPESEAVDICTACHGTVCKECIVTISGKNYCKACLEEKMSRLSAKPAKGSYFWAFLFSLMPGGGYLYLGLMKRGIQTMAVFFGIIFIGNMAQLDPLMLFIPLLVFYSIFDTRLILRRMTDGLPVEDRELFDWGTWESRGGIIGAALIALGLLALLNNLAPFLIPYHMINRIVPPLLIICAGVYILYRNTSWKGGKSVGKDKPEN